jgi:hypothetical protein
MISRSLLLTAVILFTATAIKHAPAVWRGPPQMLVALDPETRDWVKDLKNKVGSPCCDTADGFPVEVDGWNMDGIVDDTSAMTDWEASIARSGYRVRLTDGKWHDVPNFCVDRSENQQAWLCCGVGTPADEPQHSVLPSRSRGLRISRCAMDFALHPAQLAFFRHSQVRLV